MFRAKAEAAGLVVPFRYKSNGINKLRAKGARRARSKGGYRAATGKILANKKPRLFLLSRTLSAVSRMPEGRPR